MKFSNENFVNTTVTDVEEDNDRNKRTDEKDPFGDISPDIKAPKYYRLNEEVFAEPLNAIFVTNKSSEGPENEITFVGNVGVQKRPGKRNKKYFIAVEDVANLTCPQQNCRSKFSSTTLLKAHIRKVHCADRNSFVCEQCGAGFPAKYLLKRHSYVHGDSRIECPVCAKMLSARTNLSAHLRTHAAVRPHACACGKRFARACALRRHQTHVHNPR